MSELFTLIIESDPIMWSLSYDACLAFARDWHAMTNETMRCVAQPLTVA